MIHVCFGLHDATGRYSKFTGTAMLSLFDNHTPPPTAPSITVHILHDNTLTTDNRDKFSYIAGQYGQRVNFYNVEELCADKIKTMTDLIPFAKTSHLTVAALYRLLIPQILPTDIDKCIYLDSDIIINLDINELWRIELGEKVLAAAAELKIMHFNPSLVAVTNYLVTSGLINSEDYFNSGVLLMNLKILRGKDDLLMDGVKFVGEHPQLIYLDQEVLNYLFSKNYLKLPVKFNTFVRESRHLSETLAQKIYHFAGSEIRIDTTDPFNRLWMNYFIRTPFFDAGTIGRLYNSFRQMHVGLKNSMLQVSALMSGKTRAFFVAPNDINALKKIFLIRNDEEIIPAENNESLRKLLNAMNISRDKKVFFIVVPNFPFGVLTQFGFVAGKDFVNGFDFLSEAHGIPLNSNSLIKAM